MLKNEVNFGCCFRFGLLEYTITFNYESEYARRMHLLTFQFEFCIIFFFGCVQSIRTCKFLTVFKKKSLIFTDPINKFHVATGLNKICTATNTITEQPLLPCYWINDETMNKIHFRSKLEYAMFDALVSMYLRAVCLSYILHGRREKMSVVVSILCNNLAWFNVTYKNRSEEKMCKKLKKTWQTTKIIETHKHTHTCNRLCGVI